MQMPVESRPLVPVTPSADTQWVRLRRIGIFVGTTLVLLYLVMSGAFDDIEAATSWSASVAFYGAVFFIAGVLSGEWRALALVLIGWIVVALAPDATEEVRALAFIILVPIGAVGLALGVACRKIMA